MVKLEFGDNATVAIKPAEVLHVLRPGSVDTSSSSSEDMFSEAARRDTRQRVIWVSWFGLGCLPFYLSLSLNRSGFARNALGGALAASKAALSAIAPSFQTFLARNGARVVGSDDWVRLATHCRLCETFVKEAAVKVQCQNILTLWSSRHL